MPNALCAALPYGLICRLVAILFAVLLLPGCQKQVAKGPDASASSAASDSAAPAAPASLKPFTLSLSSGGGFSGAYTGYTLASDGSVRAWRKRPATPESTTWAGQANPDSIAALAKALDAYLGAAVHETGNMTTQIRYTLPDSAYQWSISGVGASAGAPEPFRTWYPRAEAWCRSATPKP